MVMKNKEGLEKGSEWSSLGERTTQHRVGSHQPVPRTGNDDRGKLRGKSRPESDSAHITAPMLTSPSDKATTCI